MIVEERKIGQASNGQTLHYSVGVLVEFQGKYLLMDRVNPPPGFACPAGHINEGEDSYHAALRELREETGIIVEKLEFVCEEEILWNFCKSSPAHYWYLYKVSVPTQIVIPSETEAKTMGWYSPGEMKKMEIEEVWRYWFEKLGIF